MAVIGYVRVSTEQQDLLGQKHLLTGYAQNRQMLIDEFIEVEISSRKNTAERRIDELLSKLKKGDTLLVAELSRLGRNMIETLQIVDTLAQRGIDVVFIRQPELSTTGAHAKLLLAVYSYFAEAERDFISMRTKQGMAAIKQATGKHMGRAKGRLNEKRKRLELLLPIITEYRTMGFSVEKITELINIDREKPYSFDQIRYFIRQEFRKKPQQ